MNKVSRLARNKKIKKEAIDNGVSKRIQLTEEQIEEYTDIITNMQHILEDCLNAVESGEIDEMQKAVIEGL